MSFYAHFMKELTVKGMFDDQAKAVMDRVIKVNKSMEGRWDNDISSYPRSVLVVISLSVSDEAVKYIKEECPEAWFRPMFEKSNK